MRAYFPSLFPTAADINAHPDFPAQERPAAAMGSMFQRKEVPAK